MCPRIGASVAIVMLVNNLDASIKVLSLWLWGGAAGAGTWGQVSRGTSHWVRGTSGGAVDGATGPRSGDIRDPLRVLEQGPDRQRAPTWCSGGVSSINGASESRCHHDEPAEKLRQPAEGDRHCSSPSAIRLHEGGFMKARGSTLAQPRQT